MKKNSKRKFLLFILFANLFAFLLTTCVTSYIDKKAEELDIKCELNGLTIEKEYLIEKCTVIPGEKLVITFDNPPETNVLNFKVIFDGQTVFGPENLVFSSNNKITLYVPNLNLPTDGYVAFVFTADNNQTIAVYRTSYRKMLVATTKNGNIKIIPLLEDYSSATNEQYGEIINNSNEFNTKHIRVSPSGRYFFTGIYSFESTSDSTDSPAFIIPSDIDVYSLPLKKKIFTVTNSPGLDFVEFVENGIENTGKFIVSVKNIETSKWKPVLYDVSDETSVDASLLKINEQQGFETPPVIAAGKNFYAVASSDDFTDVLADYTLQKGDGSFSIYSFTDDASEIMTCEMAISSKQKFVRSLYIFEDPNGNEIISVLCLGFFTNKNYPDSFKANLNYFIFSSESEEVPQTVVYPKDTVISSLPLYWKKTSDLKGNSKISSTIRALKGNISFHSFELNSHSAGCNAIVREFPEINTDSLILSPSHYNGTDTTVYWFENSEESNSEERRIISNRNNTLIIQELNKPYKSLAGFSDNKTAVLTNNAIVVLSYTDLLENITGEVAVYGIFTSIAAQ